MNDSILIKKNLKLIQEKKQLVAEIDKINRQKNRLTKELAETKKLVRHYQKNKMEVYSGKRETNSKLSTFCEYSEIMIGLALWLAGIFVCVRLVYFVTGCMATMIMGW